MFIKLRLDDVMYRVKIAIILSFTCLISLFSQTTYYVSSSQGNDANSGASESSPWKTISEVNSAKFLPSDKILFKRGDIWKEGIGLLINSSGTEGNKITFGSYGTGLKPIITLRQSIPNWNVSGTWTNYSGNIWYMDMPSYDENIPIQRLWLNGTEVKMASHYALQGWKYDPSNILYAGDNGDGTTGVCTTHQFFQNTDGKLYVYSTSNPATAYSSIEYSGGASTATFYYHTVLIKDADYITLDGLDIRGAMFSSVGLAGADYIIIENCNIGASSNHSGLYGQTQFINSTDPNCNFVEIANDTIDSEWNFDYVFYNKITQHGVYVDVASNWSIHDNYIKDWWECVLIAGIAGATTYFDVYNNELTSPNFSLSYPTIFHTRATWSTGAYQWIRFYNNYCHDFTQGIELYSSGNKLYYNIFSNIFASTNEHSGALNGGTPQNSWGLQSGSSLNGDPDSNYVFNNTWYDVPGDAADIEATVNNWFYNNLIVNVGMSLGTDIAIQDLAWSHCSYKNNLIYKTGASSSSQLFYLVGNNPPTYTLASFNALGGKISGNLQHIGSLGTLLNTNFTLPVGSKALNAGIDISSLVPVGFADRLGNTVDRKNPNIGAVANSGLGPTGFNVYLQGSYASGSMITNLKDLKLIPKAQPYNVSPWNYNGNESVLTIPTEIVDWVLVELRSDISFSSIVARQAAFIRSDGSIADLDGRSKVSFNGVNSGDYYIIIHHRNHLSIMSAGKVVLSGTSLSYDFTRSVSSSYGNDLADIGNGKYGMYAGDGDANGTVNVLDYGTVGNDLFQTGYLSGDHDLNGTVNVIDYGRTNQNLLKISNVP